MSVWDQEDVANALLATAQAGQEVAALSGKLEYLRGYRAAISTMALFFGISPALVLPDQGAQPQIEN